MAVKGRGVTELNKHESELIACAKAKETQLMEGKKDAIHRKRRDDIGEWRNTHGGDRLTGETRKATEDDMTGKKMGERREAQRARRNRMDAQMGNGALT